jgi:diadenosine tetraphosphate (Ap4A) HIT family hydrolase
MKLGSKCPFCQIALGKDLAARIVYRTDRIVAFSPLDPATKGHILVVPVRHMSSVWDLTVSEASDLSAATLDLARAIHENLSPAGLNIIQSNGAAATQTIEHVHVHLVPRYANDKMTVEWPDGAGVEPAVQAEALRRIDLTFVPQNVAVSPEDKRQHLSFIQGVITRMSQASSGTKTWLLPVIAASYGFAITERRAWVAVLGMLAALVFMILDANYLKQERSFRSLYDEVARGHGVPVFSMNASLAATRNRKSNYWPDWTEFRSWAIAPFYGPILAGGLAITGLLWFSPKGGTEEAISQLIEWLLYWGAS